MSQQINLFNPVFLKQEKLFSARAMAQALLLMTVGLLLLFGLSNYRLADTRAQSKIISSSLDAARNLLMQTIAKTKTLERNPNLDADIRNLEAHVSSSREVLGFLKNGEFDNRVAYSDVMRGFARQSMNGVWLTGFSLTDGGTHIDISGHVLQPTLVPAYIKALSKENVFTGKSFSSVMMRAPSAETLAATVKAGTAPTMTSIEFFLSSGESSRNPMAIYGGKRQ